MHASRLVSSPGLEWLRRLSRRAWWLHALLIGQLALLPCPLSRGVWVEVDTDGDGLVDSGYEDGVSEGLTEEAQAVAEPDADGDGLSDAEEVALGSDPHNPDSDYDGLTDADEVRLSGTSPLLADSDGDGITDYNAFYGNAAVDTLWAGEGATAYDWDGDGLHDPVDPDPYSAQNIGDADGDHVPDPEDSHPLDPMLWCDSNGNGVNDDAEVDGADFDGDGVSDATDSHPADPNLDNDWNDNGVDDEHEDGDGDGVSNLQDSHPNSNSLWCDWNGNGVNDDAEAAVAAGHAISGSVEESSGVETAHSGMQDQDGDGYADERDSHPADPALWNDHNGNGRNDDEEAPPDTDRDGIPDALDAVPADHDNDGLTDTEEWTLGTNPAEADSDGDGLSDGEEVYAGTDPWSVDTDGDGLTDSEELFAYHTDPLEPTAIAPPETATPSEAESMPASESAVLRVSHLVPDPGSETGQRRVEHPDGGSLAFPSKSALKSKADLTKTLTVTNGSATTLSGLSASLSGPDAAHFRLGSLANTDLAPGAERPLAVTFLAPTPTTDARSATLTLHGGEPAAPLFVLNLRSVVSSGLWTTHDDYFFADYTDSDGDGIPDLVEAMYAPLEVTASGDLDGDGTSNLDQYLAGRDLRDRAKSTDIDGDGLTNATEDAWSAAYPGKLNKYYFADAYADPDGDGLLTIEELNCLWGSDKDPQAVATHPFVAGSPPPSASKTATYKTTSRKPPKTAPASAAGETASGPLAARAGLHAAWMNDGQLRRACRETAHANGGKLPADFFTPECVVHAATATLQKTQGSDHLPRGYLLWLGRQSPAITLPAPAPAMPDSEAVQSQLHGLCLPDASDADDDAMPTAWEAAYDLNWRSAADSHLRHAIETLDQRLASNAVDLIHTAEQEAVAEVRNRLLAAQTAWPAITYPATLQDQTQTVQSHLVPVYAVDEVKFPPSLSAAAAADATRRSAWITKFTAALHWQMLASFDPDHDGLMNQDEYQQGLSPHLPDYEATGERDSDGDGFIDAIELATGTDHLDARKRPVYAIDLLTPVKERIGTTLQPLTVPVQTGLRGPTGLWPLAAQSLTVSAPDTQCLLAWGQDHAAVDWHPKTVPVGVTNDQGRITLHVHPGWKKGGLRLTFRSTPGAGLPAGLKPVRVICDLKLIAPSEDSDTDGLPDAWEARRAQGPGDPAHSLSNASALDAEAGPQHFGYHPSTPAERLPEVARDILATLQENINEYGYLPEYPVTSAAHTALAIPTTAQAIATATHKILALIDPDHDGWSNRVEMGNGTHPRVPDNPATAERDSDGDGWTNKEEIQFESNPFSRASKPSLNVDQDGDGLTLAQERELGTDPGRRDTDGDGLNDGWEQKHGLDPLGFDDLNADPDGDGLTNWQEERLGTNPNIQDTDGDGDSDLAEDNAGSSPVDSKSTVNNPGGIANGAAADAPTEQTLSYLNALGPLVPVTVTLGDWSGSYSEAYRARFHPLEGDDRPDQTISNTNYGLVQNGTVSLRKGAKYRVTLEHIASTQSRPDFDYQFDIGSAEILFHDPDGITGMHSDISQYTVPLPQANFRAKGKSATLWIPWLSSATVSDVPNTRQRTKLGVGEEVWILARPADAWNSMSFATTNQSSIRALSVGQGIYLLRAGERAGRATVTATSNLGDQTRTFAIVEPAGEKAVKVRDLDYPELSQGAGMKLEVTVQPTDVSFYNIQMREVDQGTEGVTGIFTGMNPGRLVHQVTPNWISLNKDNLWSDKAEFYGFPRHEWGNGKFEWNIGVEWRVRGGSGEINTLPTNRRQVHTIVDTTGSSKVTKSIGAQTPVPEVERNLLPIDLAIDANRDGTITQGETASEDKPFRFWLNDDHDIEHSLDMDGITAGIGQEDIFDGNKDGDDSRIKCARDLEDFSRLHMDVSSFIQQLKSGEISVGLRFTEVTGAPAIKVFRAQESDGGMRFLLKHTISEAQIAEARYNTSLGTVTESNHFILPQDFWSDGTGKAHFIFEAVGEGEGNLQIALYKNSQHMGNAASVWMDLVPIKKMYERWNAGEVTVSGVHSDVWPKRTADLDSDSSEPSGNPTADAEKDFILFVHGWNMTQQEKRSFAETAYKRLWQIGYKGRFGSFFWPTFYATTIFEKIDPRNFDGSEHRAWESSDALLGLMTKLNQKYPGRLHVIAHSMGNVVTSEALHKASGIVAKNYISSQAALAADLFKLNPDVTSQWATVLAHTFTGYGIAVPGARPVSTPNVYSYYYTNGRDEAYRRQQYPEMGEPFMQGVGGAEKWHNFLNPYDWALGAWIYNQSQKPNGNGMLPGNDYEYAPVFGGTWGFKKSNFGINNDRYLYTPEDTYEIFCYCAQARSNATGRQSGVGGPFTAQVNFAAFDDKHPGHSAQFLYSIARRWDYWDEVLKSCVIQHMKNLNREP